MYIITYLFIFSRLDSWEHLATTELSVAPLSMTNPHKYAQRRDQTHASNASSAMFIIIIMQCINGMDERIHTGCTEPLYKEAVTAGSINPRSAFVVITTIQSAC